MSRETVGKIAQDLAQKAHDNTHTATDQMKEQLSEYEENLLLALEEGHKQFSDTFYVVVLVKKERLLTNVYRHMFFSRKSCPTPEWDQTVYQFDGKTQELKFLWTIPDKVSCGFIKENALTLPPDQMELVKFVLSFEDGSLLALAKHLNNEHAITPETIIKNAKKDGGELIIA